MFDVVDHIVCGDVIMPYFPGADVKSALLQGGDYKKLCGERLTNVKKFIKPPEYASGIINACVSSVPRWRFARVHDADPNKKPKNAAPSDETDDSDDDRFDYVSADQDLRGVARAQRGLLDESIRITKGGDTLSEFLINRESDHGPVRLEVWRSIAESSLYLSEETCRAPSTRIVYLGGYIDVHYLKSITGRPRFCSETGEEGGIYRCLPNMPDDERMVATERRMALVLGSVSKYRAGKRGGGNGYLEGLCSICRMLGLKLVMC